MRRVLSGVLAAAIGLASRSVIAQPSPTPGPSSSPSAEESDPTAEALAHFRKGNELFKQEAWAAALAELLLSRRLKPTRNATANAAYCLRRLGRYDEALDLYESVLRDFTGIPADLKDEAQRAILELRGLVGTIEIDDSEPGASISIDGRTRGEHPSLAPLRVAAGSHAVRVYKEGFEPFETRVDVAGKATAHVIAKLRPLAASGRLKVIEQSGREMEVLIDGSLVGQTPWEGRVPAGEHVVVLRGEGDLGTAPARVAVELNRTVPLTLAAEELSAVLRVEPVPAGAHVAIDAVAVGRGIWEGRLRAGEHAIEIAEPGFRAQTMTVSLLRGARERIEVTLERDETSPFWRKPERRARFFAEISASIPFVPFGGSITAGCIEPCALTGGVGAHGVVRGGYELGVGFGGGVAFGFLTAQQGIRDRPVALRVDGLPDHRGTGADTLGFRAWLLGGWLGMRIGTRFPMQLRMTVAALHGDLSDARTAVFTSSTGKPYRVGTLVETYDASFVYVAPELRIGLPLGDRVELSAGLEVPVLVAIDRAVWDPTRAVVAGGDGQGTFAAESITGAVLVAVAPGVGARYDF
ncbi:MAG: PEGA domain-containing protein [Polyangiaceae bacterium]